MGCRLTFTVIEKIITIFSNNNQIRYCKYNKSYLTFEVLLNGPKKLFCFIIWLDARLNLAGKFSKLPIEHFIKFLTQGFKVQNFKT